MFHKEFPMQPKGDPNGAKNPTITGPIWGKAKHGKEWNILSDPFPPS